MMNKGKKFIVLLLAVCMILTMFSGVTVSAATDVELYSAKVCTIKPKASGKYYYYNEKGKKDTTKGWKKNEDGKYTYYVNGNGVVSVKVTKSGYYKWTKKGFKKQSLKKNSIKKIKGKAFFVGKDGKFDNSAGKKKVSKTLSYYVNKNGVVSFKVKNKVYYKWSKKKTQNGFKKYTKSILTINKKAYYVNANGKIDKTLGWKTLSSTSDASVFATGGSAKCYVGTGKSVLYKQTSKGSYTINSNGKVSKKLKEGWNGSIFVKNGKVQVNKTTTAKGYMTVFNEDGKRVTLKVKNDKIVRSDTGETVTEAGNYKVGTGNNKKTYAAESGGKVKTSGTVTINGKKYAVSRTGKCTKKDNKKTDTKKDDQKKDDQKSDNKKSDQKKEPATEEPTTETTTEESTTETTTEEPTTESTTEDEKPEAHVCKWKPITENGEAKKFNYKEHAEVKVLENQVVAVAWDEPVYEERDVCRTCGERFPTEKMDGHAAWINHVLTTNHGNYSPEDVQVDTIHHPEERADVEVVKERAYSEWDQKYKCTVCGDIMTEHVVCGDTDSEQGECAFILDKGGDLLYSTGEFRKTVSSGTYYGVFYDAVKDSKYTDYLQLLKDHGFIK